jgi:hypothetical protein
MSIVVRLSVMAIDMSQKWQLRLYVLETLKPGFARASTTTLHSRFAKSPVFPRPELVPHASADLVEVQQFDQAAVNNSSGSWSETFGGSMSFQELQSFVAPKKFGHPQRRDIGIHASFPNYSKCYVPGVCVVRQQHVPPAWNHLSSLRKVVVRYDKRDSIEDRVVDTSLSGKSPEIIVIALQLVTVQVAVHDGDINARGSMS